MLLFCCDSGKLFLFIFCLANRKFKVFAEEEPFENNLKKCEAETGISSEILSSLENPSDPKARTFMNCIWREKGLPFTDNGELDLETLKNKILPPNSPLYSELENCFVLKPTVEETLLEINNCLVENVVANEANS